VAAKEVLRTVSTLVLAGIFDNYTGFLSGLNNSKSSEAGATALMEIRPN
jgi:hypothetical protein